MRRDGDRQKTFGRRAALLAGAKGLLLTALAGRLYYLQVVEAERYATLAEENRISLRLLAPPRGRLLDRHERPLAVNQKNFQVILVAEQAKDIEGTLDALGQLIEIPDQDRRRILREVRRRRSFVPVTVRENLSWDDVARVEVNAPDLPGVSIDVGQSRAYPFGEQFAHVLGYVAAVSERDLQPGGDPLLQLPDFRIGKSGIEKTHDMALRGRGGSSQVEVNAYGRTIRELERTEGQPGVDVVLTVDADLQRLAHARLGPESGSAVVLDVHSGEVLALASTPSFDPAAFNRGLTGDEWRSLIGNPRGPLTNKAIAGQYAPGSTFKMVVALAALEAGAITPATRVSCPGVMWLGDAEFHCWKRHGHGGMNVHTAIVQSCDVFFYEAARRIGIDRITAMARRFGMGGGLGLDLPGEVGGLMPTRAWKEATIGQSWAGGETLIAGIGQGYLLTTPLQLAMMAARLVNGGFAVKPRLTRDLLAGSGAFARAEAVPERLAVNPANLALVRDAMRGVVNERGGTAQGSRAQGAGFEIGGKTGTVQVRRISKAERERGIRKQEELPWIERDHALFVGYAPTEAPRVAAAVVVEHGGSGSKVAAPIARDLLVEAIRRLDGPMAARAPAPGEAPDRPERG